MSDPLDPKELSISTVVSYLSCAGHDLSAELSVDGEDEGGLGRQEAQR